MFSHGDHIREIERVALGQATNRDTHVIESWRRCLDRYRMDPAAAREAVILPAERLKEHRQQAEELITIARSGLDSLYRQVAGQAYVLLLADRQGVTVDFIGDPLFDGNLRKAGLYLGSKWTEDMSGTCAVGSCLATGEALIIHQTDHFDTTHTPLSCTSAPIYDASGELSAVLDISLLSSPSVKTSQNLALHLVTAAARRIELAHLMARTRHQWVLRFARSPDFIEVDPEAAIAIDDAGRIAGMTHGGARVLARAVGDDWRAPQTLIGKPVSRFLDLDIDDLPDLTRGRATNERVVRARDGDTLFAHAIEPKAVRRSVVSRPLPAPFRELGGNTPEMMDLQHKAAKLARAALPILIQGETGTGKEHLARAIHDGSGVAGRFVAINCAAIPEALIESELFGHAAGAFTGAAPKGRKGLIEQADGGTLFLDEIGDMPIALQSRLLRVLAEREVQPVGAVMPKPVRLRVISASHRSLPELVAQGTFREDLYYRLCAAVLRLPPLRERSDFDWLLARLVERHRLGDGAVEITPAARAALRGHEWPGNIRELDNVIAVALAMADGDMIDLEDLPEGFGTPPQAVDGKDDAAVLRTTLAACDWNVSEAARRMGVDRTTVHRQIRRFGIATRN